MRILKLTYEETTDGMTGFDLIYLLIEYANRDTVVSFGVKDNIFFIEYFNPNAGEDSSLEFEIKELKGV